MVFAFGRQFDFELLRDFEIERNLAGATNGVSVKPSPGVDDLLDLDSLALDGVGVEDAEHAADRIGHDAFRRPQCERLHLAHHQQAGDVVDVAVGRESP